jgi:DNA-binding MarR family transcriptional regulator
MASLRLLVLDFVRSYIGRHGVSPSYGEIAAGLGCGRTSVKRAVKSLVAAGLLLQRPGARGIALPAQRDLAVRLLREHGWNVDEDVQIAHVPLPGTKSTLLPTPALK